MLQAATSLAIPSDCIIVIDGNLSSAPTPQLSIDALIKEGQGIPILREYHLGFGNSAKKKIAFLCFSSGTIGQPKVRFLACLSRELFIFLSGSGDFAL